MLVIYNTFIIIDFETASFKSGFFKVLNSLKSNFLALGDFLYTLVYLAHPYPVLILA